MLLDIHQPGAVDMVDDKTEDQPHAEMMGQPHPLIAEERVHEAE